MLLLLIVGNLYIQSEVAFSDVFLVSVFLKIGPIGSNLEQIDTGNIAISKVYFVFLKKGKRLKTIFIIFLKANLNS
jgi:hypothetical protein